MNFIEWLAIDEGRRFRQKGPTPGAFGRDPGRARLRKLRTPGEEAIGRGAISGMDQPTRSGAGRDIEKLVMRALREVAGWKIEDASMKQDMVDKIDGWKIDGAKKTPIQVKFRDSGNDIAVKVEWRGKPGRDMRGGAELYAVLDQSGYNIRVRRADEVKRIAERMLAEFNRNGRPSMLRLDDGDIRKSYDPFDGYPIVMAYINPESPSFTYQENFRLPKVVWQYRAA